VERYSEPRPVPPLPQRFDEPSTTAGDVDPDRELRSIAEQDAETQSEQAVETEPVEDAAVAERAGAVADGEPVSEQIAEIAQLGDADRVEKAEAAPEAEAGPDEDAEALRGDAAASEQNADAIADAESAPESQPAPAALPVVTPSAQDAPAARKTDAVSVQPDNAVQRSETAEEMKAAARDDGIVGVPAVGTETARDTVAALAAPAPTPPAAPHDEGLGKLIGQMIVTGFDGTTPEDGGVKRLIALLESGKAGGALITSRNVRSPEQLRALIDVLKKANAGVAPFLMVAHEGGDGQSLSAMHGFSMYPSAAELGRSNDPLNAFSVYFHMAGELASYGFNVNLGPVVDLEPKGGGAGAEAAARSFGPEPKHVAAFGKAFRLAHRQKGIATVLKYFPRQAGSEADGSVGAALETYRQLIESDNADMVMTSHLIDPAFSDAAGRPASLSVKAIRKRLREDLGFKGVVMSADIGDPAVAALLPLSERVAGAIGAGTDILLIGERASPQDGAVEAIAAIVREAVASGRLSRDQLAASHGRIMSMKQSLGASAKSIASAEGKGAREPAAQ
jgi:beta-N-acetylhexosaminidase